MDPSLGDSSNEATGDWHRDEHEASDDALAAAKTKIAEGQIVHAIYSPADILWMKREEFPEAEPAAAG